MTRLPVPNRAITGSMTHREMEAWLRDTCAELGLRAWIQTDRSPYQTPGWFDAVIIGKHNVMFVELKTETGRRTRAQIECATDAIAAGQPYMLVHPAELGKLREELETL